MKVEERGGAEVPQEKWEESGVGGLSARIFLLPISGKSMKLHLVFYPEAPEVLTQANDMAASPTYPGICVYRTEIKLGIPGESDQQWGCPWLPCLVGKPPISRSSRPSDKALLAAIFALMRSTVSPELKSNYNTLRSRWAELNKEGASVKNVSLEFIWPEPPSVESSSKNLNYRNKRHSLPSLTL